jgi:hypothetical protein
MTRLSIAGLILTVTVGFGLVAAWPVEAQRRPLGMLDELDFGRWELRFRSDQDPSERICLHNGRALIQLRHPARTCERIVVEDSADSVTVQYTCHGHGYGRTHIRRETDRLIQLESQGVAEGLPFDFTAEGRRIGDCPA